MAALIEAEAEDFICNNSSFQHKLYSFLHKIQANVSKILFVVTV